MKIYKACPEYNYDRMEEAYYTRLEDAVDAVNRFMERLFDTKWVARYHFIGTETRGDVTNIIFDGRTKDGSIVPIRTMPAVMAVELNGLEEKT